MSDVYLHTAALMGTVVTFQVVDRGADQGFSERAEGVARAVQWFQRVEACCSRFDASSELRQLTARIGEAVPLSPILFEAIRFALAVADDTGGAFDPTIGAQMEARGFNRDYRSGDVTASGLAWPAALTFRDVQLDLEARTATLLRPLVLDLGGVAKGLAIDLAARELERFQDYAIDAGGDLYLAGRNPDHEPWSVGIRDPRDRSRILETIAVTDAAVCTSGDYERRDADGRGHHLLDPRTGESASALASVTVVAGTAIVADALATAAFVLGPDAGLALLERSGVEGLLMTAARDRVATRGMPRATVLPNA